jgi:hypothetical protein
MSTIATRQEAGVELTSSALRVGTGLMTLGALAFMGYAVFDTIGHLGLIYLATAVFVVGAVLAGKALLDARRGT